ncbi:sugar ABC transporter permease [Rhizocola hellebori]|uniref:Maltose/maltodextrin transport system permease protein n=1 Tax=Rhizocola hellebori TaxID=1392758 RepID=A0A8J3QK38_9ACTN|nr:ABC transporter permease subunit [Rhizocola hellebori]GIH10838.1 sugar ABC transporter permease [Rhizocola hellebori]
MSFLVSRIATLAITAAILFYAVPPLIGAQAWVALAILAAAAGGVAYLYLTPKHIAAKYLVPGTIFLIIFQVLPILYTFTVAFTNLGDGHRGSKQEAIAAIERESLVEIPDAPDYALTVALADDKVVFLLVDQDTKAVQVGTVEGLSKLDGAEVGVTGKVLSAPGYEIIQASERDADVQALVVPTPRGAIKSSGLSRAIELEAKRKYDAQCDCVVEGGKSWNADDARGYFVDSDGNNLIQGWKVNVGWANFTRTFSDPNISGHFLGVLIWNLVFALSSVALTFALGMAVALALHSPRMRGTRIYRTILILPYAMPSFAMLLVWRDMFNRDFGLLNRVLGTDLDWLGTPTGARLGLLMVNLWLGFPYMFLVATGALQAIPRELTEASGMDGASPWQSFRRVTLPLLLIALTPLLIASFAFNFNNFNLVRFVTNGGPYAVDNSLVGKTDLLITYTYRLAFEGGQGQLGFAAAISTFIFAIVATISTIAFRRTRAQEEVYS